MSAHNERAFSGYDQWKTSEPDYGPDWDPEEAAEWEIASDEDLADFLDARHATEDDISRAIYSLTVHGILVKLTENGISFKSATELGAKIQVIAVKYPCTGKDILDAIQKVEDEAEALWIETIESDMEEIDGEKIYPPWW